VDAYRHRASPALICVHIQHDLYPANSWRSAEGRKNMKDLIITKTKDIYYMLPDERRMVLMAAAVAFTEKLVKAHKMKEVHVMPGCHIGIG
jgi:hypothetical protein